MVFMLTVQKLDHTGKLVTSYQAELVSREGGSIVLEARWNRAKIELPYVTFEPGDRLVEYYFTDRWYNIFEIHAGDDGRLKGWYCNITRPAVFTDSLLSAVDLALDLFVHPDGRIETLDEDEFEALHLPEEDSNAYQQALAAASELRALARAHRPPFGPVDSG